MSSDIAVLGVAQSAYARDLRTSTPDLVFTTVQAALIDAGLSMAEVDLVVAGFAPDGLAGEGSPDKSFLPAAGSVGRASFRVNTGGATGIGAAFSAIEMLEGGMGDVAVVVGVERMAQAATVPAIFNSIFDPVYERDTGLSTLSMCAMRATRMMKLWGYTREQWASVSVRNYAHALRNPYAQIRKEISVEDVLNSRMLVWPITQYDACPISEGVCVVVLARGEAVGRPNRPVAWVRGRGSTSDTYEMGDRIGRPDGDLVEMLTLQRSADRAYAAAGITSAHDAQVVEIHSPFSSAETMAYMPLRLCRAEDGPDLVASGFGAWGSATVLQPSGGPQTANPVGATALVRFAECAEQVRGRAGDRQVPGARIAIATGQGGASQFSTCTVLSST